MILEPVTHTSHYKNFSSTSENDTINEVQVRGQFKVGQQREREGAKVESISNEQPVKDDTVWGRRGGQLWRPMGTHLGHASMCAHVQADQRGPGGAGTRSHAVCSLGVGNTLRIRFQCAPKGRAGAEGALSVVRYSHPSNTTPIQLPGPALQP